MIEKRLTEEEAEKFIELKEKVDKDMNGMWDELPSASVLERESFEEEYGFDGAKVQMALTRGRYKEFCKMIYL